VSSAAPTPSAPRPTPSAARHLFRALLILGGVALFLLLAFNGVLFYVRTPAGTARLLRLGLGAANDAISGRIEAEGATIHGSHVVVHRAALYDAEGAEVASVERIDADIHFAALLLGHIEAETLKLTRPRLSVVLDEDGSNLDRTFSARHPGPPDAGGKPAPLTFIVRHLDLEEGRLSVHTPDGPPFLLQALELEGAGRYALRSEDFELEARGNGGLDEPTPGPATISLRGYSRGSAFEAEVDIRAGGASVVGDVHRNTKQPLNGRVALDVPPKLARALLRGWPLRVPLELTAEARGSGSGSGFLISGDAAAGRARLQLRADVDVEHSSARSFRIDASHLHLRELFGQGPDTDFAFSLRGQGSGNSLASANGTLQLSVPSARVRNADVGPLELSARVQGGRYEVSALRAALPGLELTGTGRGTTRSVEASLHLEVRDLSALTRTLGDVLGPVPKLGGHGTLNVALSGHPSHPGVEAEGRFSSLAVGSFAAQGLELTFKLPDVARPLDANANLVASQLELAGRSMKDVHAVLHTQGRAAELEVTSGAVHLQLAGTADADARGVLLDTLSLGFPEETFSLKAPAAVRFDEKRLQTERLELVSGAQSLAFSGGREGSRLEATLEVAHLELGHLPALLAPPSLRLGGTLSLTAAAHGPEHHPDVEGRADVENGAWHGLKDITVHLEAGRKKERLSLNGHVLALGTAVDVALDAPELALRQRIHQPLTLQLKAQGLDVAHVLCELAGAGFLRAACPNGTAVAGGQAGLDVEVAGFADGPAVHLTLGARQLTARGLSVAQATLKLEGDDTVPLGLSVSSDVLGGALEAHASLKATTGQLLARRPSWAGWRTLPVQASLLAKGLNLASLQQARLSSRDMQGTLDAHVELTGTLAAPRGQADVSGHGLLLPPLPAGEAHLVLTATDTLDARLTLLGPAGEKGKVHLSLGAPLEEVLAGLSPEALGHAALSLEGDLGPIELRDMPFDTNRLRRDRRLLDGQFHVEVEAHGTLLAPTLAATLTATGLGPKDGAHVEGTAHLHSTQGKQAFDVKLQSQTGGTLDLEGEAGLDVSWPALRRGLHLAEAPLRAELHSVHFEPDFVASLMPWMRSISGKLEVEGKADGTLGKPTLKGSVSWTDGALGIIGFGLYQNIQLHASASNDRFDIQQLSAKVQGGTVALQLAGERAASGFNVTGALRTVDFPVVFDDQLWCMATLTADLSGTARLWELNLSQVNVTQAELQLPEAKRKNLQGLSAPPDVILTRHGVPLDADRAARALALDPRHRGQAVPEREAKNIFLRLGLEAPNHISVRSKDILLELGLSKPFQVDVGDQPQLFGAVRILRGRGDVWGRRFEVQPGGQVRFDGPPEEAVLDVTGVYASVQSQAKVYMHFSGEVTNVKVTPSSDPPMSESEIYTLLATGRTQLAQSSLGSSTAVGGADAGASILGSWAATELKKSVGAALPIDVLSVEVGNDERGYNQTRLEAGKYLTDDIYIGYQARTNADPFRYQNANAIRVEYRFLRRWSLQFEYGDANAGSLDAVWSRDY
jgi:translocation and assembly module TamB